MEFSPRRMMRRRDRNRPMIVVAMLMAPVAFAMTVAAILFLFQRMHEETE